MASVPLAALAIRPPEQPDLMGNYAKLVQLKSLMQQQQYQQQMQPLQLQQAQGAIQLQGLQTQEAQRTLERNQALDQSFQNAYTVGPDGTPTINRKAIYDHLSNNNAGSLIPQVETQLATVDEKHATTAKANADAQKAIGETQAASADYLGSIGAVIKASKYDPVVAATALGHAAALGGPYADHAQQILDHIKQNPQDLQPLTDELIAASPKQIEAAKNVQATAQSAQETEKLRLQNLQWQQGALPPDIAKAKYERILTDIASKKPVSADDMAFARAHEAAEGKVSTAADTLGVTSTTTSGPTGLARVGGARVIPAGGVSPAVTTPQVPQTPAAGVTAQTPLSAMAAPQAAPIGVQPVPRPAAVPQAAPTAAAAPTATQPTRGAALENSIVDQIGLYKMSATLFNRMLIKHPEIIGMVAQKYPDFDQTNYQARQALITKYTSGPQSQEIGAINTVAAHLGALDNAISALNNGNVQVMNRIANAYGVQVGKTPAATFQTIVHRIGPEITKAYVAGGGGEAERFANAADFDPALAPNILHSNVATTLGLLGGKIDALEQPYKTTMQRDDFRQRFITPAAQQTFQRLAPSGGGNRKVDLTK